MFDVDQMVEEYYSMLYQEHKESELDNLMDYFKSVFDVKAHIPYPF